MPQPKLAAAMLSQRIDIGRAHPPYANWARITIGLPEENQRSQIALRLALKGAVANRPASRNESRSSGSTMSSLMRTCSAHRFCPAEPTWDDSHWKAGYLMN
jgi:hypothetical protein